MSVVVFDEVVDFGHQFFDAGERAAADGLLGDEAKPTVIRCWSNVRLWLHPEVTGTLPEVCFQAFRGHRCGKGSNPVESAGHGGSSATPSTGRRSN